MGKYYLAVDIGASSGRHILGHLENGKIELEEIYRFENGMDHKDGKLLWNVDRLFGEILNGMKKCKEQGKIPVSMAIDTWAVDYVLLDEKDRILGDTYGYRDHRTDGMDAEVAKILPETELYAKTGIQKQIFNTIYQLMAEKQKEPELLQRAETLLMLPDYFGFRLTGNKLSEYTNGSTTQLVNPTTFQWDTDLIRKLGYPEDIMVDAYQDITIPFQMSSVEFFTMVKDHLKDGGVMVVNMNMHGNKEGDINQYLADTIANVFDNVYTVDVAGSTNRELFASQHSDMIEVLSDHVENLSDAGLQNMMQRVADNSSAYVTEITS